MAVSNVELRVDARQAVNALRDAMRASAQAETATQKLKSAFATAGQVQSVFSAKVANTEAAIRQQIAALREVQSKVQIGGALYQKAGKQIAEYEARLQSANRATNEAASALAGLAIGAAAFNAQRIATSFLDAANAANAAQSRIKLVSQGFDDYRLVLQSAQNAADTFGLSQTQAANAVADIYTRLRPVGFQLNEINAIYEGFNTAVKLSGVNADAASAAFLQLSQGLGSGTLQGDELRSVLEQMPTIAQAIAKELDINVGSIKKFGSEGKITADVIVRALDRVRTEGAQKLAESLDTPQQRIVDLENAFEDFKIEVASSVAPVVTGSIKQITAALKEATRFVGDLKSGFEVLAGAMGGVSLGVSNIDSGLGGLIGRFNEMGRNKGLAMLLDVMTLGGASILGGVANVGARKRGAKGYDAPAGPEVPIRLSMQGRDFGGRDTKKGKGSANKAAREAERAAEAAAKEQARVGQVIRDRLAEGQILQLRSTIQDKIAAAETAGDKQLVARLQGQQKALDIQYRYAQELAKEKDIRAQEAIIYEGNTALVANQREVQRELNELQQESAVNQIAALERQVNLQAELTDGQRLQQELGNGIANTIGQGMTSAFDALIQGSESFSASLRRIASGVLVDIARQLIQIYIINKAISAIGNLFGPKAGGLSYSGVSGSALSTSMLSGNFTATPFSTAGMGLSFRANGGSVRAGQPYVVGERGPELFMPGRSGGIAPTGSFGGGVNVVVNVDATGSKVQGDQGQGAQLGRVVANAVQAELIKQKRPGGLLA
jgi:tape measure domain-containing protein